MLKFYVKVLFTQYSSGPPNVEVLHYMYDDDDTDNDDDDDTDDDDFILWIF